MLKKPFITAPHQEKNPQYIHMSPAQEKVVDMEISEILTKEAISLVQENQEKIFLSNLLLLGKQYGCHRPIVSLKELNRHIS